MAKEQLLDKIYRLQDDLAIMPHAFEANRDGLIFSLTRLAREVAQLDT